MTEQTHVAFNYPIGEVRQHNGRPSASVLDLPWYKYVPKEPHEQLAWRLYIRERGAKDERFRQAILQACQADVLFFANSLVSVYEPRRLKRRRIPLNTYPDQDDHICWMEECFAVRSVGIEKSRDLGLSWDLVLVFYKHWRFDQAVPMGLCSLTEEKVDSKTDPDALMWKADFIHKNTPEWFRVDEFGRDILDRTYNDHRFYNRANESCITGYACTGNLGRGGRKIAWGMDEFSEWPVSEQQRALDATQFTTHCRYFPSTFSGDSDRFYEMMRREKSTMLKLIADWKDNPEKKRGMYTSIGGHLKIIDKSYVFPVDYPFILDNKTRSPYYDAKCKDVGATPQSIARELDRDPQGATSKVFAASVLQKARETCREPYFRGTLDFTPGDYIPIWIPDKNGRVHIWKDLDEDAVRLDGGKGKLGWGGPYAVGCDIGVGAGSSQTSNSSIAVIDIASGEEVLQYYWHMIRPVDFAQLVFVLCKWLCEDHDLSWAYLNWEHQGPGEVFTKEIVRVGWPNCYTTRQETTMYRTRTEKLGYFNQDSGYTALCELQRGIQQDEVTIRSEMTVMECGQYEIGRAGERSGKCIHVGSASSGDPASQGKSHGDCAIALALAWMAAKDRPVDKEQVVVEASEEDFHDTFLEKFLKRNKSSTLLASRPDFVGSLRFAE